MNMKYLLTAITLACTPFVVFSADNLVVNGDFEKVNREGLPVGWEISHFNYLDQNNTRVLLMNDGDFNYLHVRKNSSATVNLGTQVVDLPDGATSLQMRIRMSGKNVVAGDQHWMVPGLGISFSFPDGSSRPGIMSNWIYLPTGDSPWDEYESVMPIRENAVKATVSIIGHGWTGEANFADIRVEAIH